MPAFTLLRESIAPGRLTARMMAGLVALGMACVGAAAAPVGELGAADRLVVRGLETTPAERLRAGLLGDAELYWLGVPTADRDAYLAALGRRSTLALEAAGFAEPRVRVAVERDDGGEIVVIDVVEGPRFMAGPIRVTGLPDDLAARLATSLQESQPPYDAQPESITLPDGSTTIQWVKKDGEAVKLVEPGWRPGEPAPHHGPGRESLLGRIGDFFQREGLYALTGIPAPDADDALATLKEHVAVALRHEDGLAVLAIDLKRLPPHSTLAAIEIGPDVRTTREELQTFLGLEIGGAVSEVDRVTWREKLRQSGRFLSQDVVFTLEPQGVVARFDLAEYEHARPWDAPPSREEQALRRFRSWILGEWHAGRELRVRFARRQPQEADAPPTELDVVLGRDAGWVISIQSNSARYGCAVVRDGLGLFAPTAQLESPLPAGSRPFLNVGVDIAAEKKADGSTRHRRQLAFGAGLTTAKTTSLPFHVEPVWCSVVAHTATSRPEGDDLVIEFAPSDPDGDEPARQACMRIDPATGALRRVENGDWVFTIDGGNGMVERAFADLRATSGANLAEATRPLESLQRFVIASCEALPPALDGFVAAETLARFTDQCRTLAERIRVTQAEGLPGKVDTIVAKVLAGGESRLQTDVLPVPDDDFGVPAIREARDPDRVATVAVRTLGPIALRWLEERLGRDAWPVAATRVAAMHVGRFDEAAAERELDRLVESGGFAEACDGMAALLGEEAESMVSLRTTLSEWLARRHLFAGRLAAATAVYREALDRTEKTAGPDSEEAMKLRLHCGLTLLATNDLADAVPLIERVAEAGDAAGLDPVKVTDAHRFLVLALVAVKDFDRAITFAEAFLARVEAGQADDACRREVPRVREIIGFCHGQTGDLEKSLAVYRTLLEEADERHGPDHPETSKLLHNTMWLLNQTGDVDEAYRLNRRPRAEIERRSIVGLEGPNPARRKQSTGSGRDDTSTKKSKADTPKPDDDPSAVNRWSGLDLPAVRVK